MLIACMKLTLSGAGSVWEWDEIAGEFCAYFLILLSGYTGLTGEQDLHIFGVNQPDLNWDCEEVRKELYNVCRFWLDKGVDGFRVSSCQLCLPCCLPHD
jgi:oligo-1,6-glucosidase